MRNTKKEITEKAAIEAVLRDAQVLHLGMCDPDGQDPFPYVLPLNFGYKDGVVYVHSARKGLKIETLRRCPRVCFSVVTDAELRPPKRPEDVAEDAKGEESASGCGFGMRFRSVVGFGRAEIVEDIQEVDKGLRVVMQHYTDMELPFLESVLRKTAIIRITVESMTGKQDLRVW